MPSDLIRAFVANPLYPLPVDLVPGGGHALRERKA